MSRVGDSALADWFEQVADAMDAGMDPVNAVALARQLPGGRSSDLAEAARKGRAWSDNEGLLRLELAPAELAAVRAGERTATLPDTFRTLAEWRRQRAQTRRRLLLASLYPVLIIHMAAVVFPIRYLAEGDVARFAVAAGMALAPFWLLFGFAVALSRWAPALTRGLQRGIPIVQAYRSRQDMATLCQILAACLQAGLPVRVAWQTALEAMDHPRIQSMGAGALEAIERGKPASSGIAAEAARLPGSFLQLYRGGESIGRLEQNLKAAAQSFQREAQAKLILGVMVYSKLALAGVFGYVAYRIVTFFADYYEALQNLV